jgi:thiamine biosynthesis lipoprotein
MALTLNALAQGHATDRVLAAVAAEGIAHAFLDTGELGALGRAPEGRPWRVGVAHPRREDATLGTLDLASRRFIATSGDWQCAWTADYREHHIVDPSRGHSPPALAEVAVIASSGLMADGLSTAAMVAGPDHAAMLLALDPAARAIFVDKAGRVTTSGFAPTERGFEAT